MGGDLEIRYYASAQGIDYRVECSTDLLRWQSEGITLSAPDDDGISTASISPESPHRLLRLIVSE